mmetsp:Transcript_22383/g.61848  ORF Transcript_22383/g.61848 Transcript_22383/m.61848 type:complete len:243 (-) Transcript_22383:735-1463(-)
MAQPRTDLTLYRTLLKSQAIDHLPMLPHHCPLRAHPRTSRISILTHCLGMRQPGPNTSQCTSPLRVFPPTRETMCPISLSADPLQGPTMCPLCSHLKAQPPMGITSVPIPFRPLPLVGPWSTMALVFPLRAPQRVWTSTVHGPLILQTTAGGPPLPCGPLCLLMGPLQTAKCSRAGSSLRAGQHWACRWWAIWRMCSSQLMLTSQPAAARSSQLCTTTKPRWMSSSWRVTSHRPRCATCWVR